MLRVLVSCHKHCKTLSRDSYNDSDMSQYEAMMKRALSHADDQVHHTITCVRLDTVFTAVTGLCCHCCVQLRLKLLPLSLVDIFS